MVETQMIIVSEWMSTLMERYFLLVTYLEIENWDTYTIKVDFIEHYFGSVVLEIQEGLIQSIFMMRLKGYK